MKYKILIFAFAGIALFSIFGKDSRHNERVVVSSANNVDGSSKAAAENRYAKRIDPTALSPYTKAGYPKMMRKYATRIKEIEQFRRRAAELAVDSGKCDFVEWAEMSINSSTLKKLRFWVDCKNGERIYFDEFEISKNAVALTQKERAWDKGDARIACRKFVKESALIPNELDVHDFVGTSVYQAPVTQNVVVKIDFDAKNAFGVEFSYTATCTFPSGEQGEYVITER